MGKKAKMGRQQFDAFCRKHGMMPHTIIQDAVVDGQQVGDILLADSGDLIPLSQYPPIQGNEHGMVYFFRTGFGIYRDNQGWVANFNDYPPDAFSDFEPGSRQQQRLNEALQYAAQILADTHEAGLYRGNDRRIIN